MVCFQYKTASTRTCCQCTVNSFCVVVLLWLLKSVCTGWFKEKAWNSIMNQCITSSFLSLWYMCWLSWVKCWNEWRVGRCEKMGGRRILELTWTPPQTNHVFIRGCLFKKQTNKKSQNKTKPKTSTNPPKLSPTIKQMPLLTWPLWCFWSPQKWGNLRFSNSDLRYEDSGWGCCVMSETCSTPSQLAGG